MDLIKAEIERKKRQLENRKDILIPNKKYFKRGDLVAKQNEEYWKKHNKSREDTPEPPPKDEKQEKGDKENSEEEKVPHLSRKEVVRRLRERQEPIRLFGESDYEAFERLKKIEMLDPDIKKGEGFENDFKQAMDRVDQDYLNEIVNASLAEESRSSTLVAVKDDGTTSEDITQMRDQLDEDDNDKNHEIILKFLKFILKVWGDSLNARSEEVKRTRRGKEDSAIHSQTVNYMKPLFRKLKSKSVDFDILDCLIPIIKHLMDRDYLRANDCYLEMAIGNSPWPIGVTMVGIHARTGREKISSRNVAHVLNDETQRKYIQGLKRLMTQCQKFFPTDPSRSVDFVRETSS